MKASHWKMLVTWRLQTSVSTFQSKGGPWTWAADAAVCLTRQSLLRGPAASGTLVVAAVTGDLLRGSEHCLGTDDFGHWKEAKATVSCGLRKVEGSLPRDPGSTCKRPWKTDNRMNLMLLHQVPKHACSAKLNYLDLSYCMFSFSTCF